MPTTVEHTLKTAIRERRIIQLKYAGKRSTGIRVGRPHALYIQAARAGHETTLLHLLQTGGTSSRTLPAWAPLRIDNISDVVLLDDTFTPDADFDPTWYSKQMRRALARVQA